MKTTLVFLIMAIGILSIVATGGDDYDNCDLQINNQINARGTTSDVSRYDADGYHSHTYCWHKSWDDYGGICYDFTWGDDFDCEVSQYSY